MKESAIAEFLAGSSAVEELRSELLSSQSWVDAISTEVSVEQMSTEFTVTREMALHACDAGLAGQLPPEALRLLAFTIITSDHFTWGEDELLGEILYDWSGPEVNFPLTSEYLVQFRSWLDGTAPYPSEAGCSADAKPGRVINRLIRKSV